jgi:hypothetical protein
MANDVSRVEIYAALPMPFTDKTVHRDELYAMINDLCKLTGRLKIDLYWHGKQPLEIQLLQPTALRRKLLLNNFGKALLARCEIVKFSTVVPFSDAYDVPSGDANRDFIREVVSKRVSDIFVMANLSRVGSIQVSDSLIVQDGRLKEYSKLPAMDAWPLHGSGSFSLLNIHC